MSGKMIDKNSIVFVDLDDKLIQIWKEKVEEQTQICLKENPSLFTGKKVTTEESKEETGSQQAAVVAVHSQSNSAVMPNVAALEDS